MKKQIFGILERYFILFRYEILILFYLGLLENFQNDDVWPVFVTGFSTKKFLMTKNHKLIKNNHK
jgi:hypothetical protein